MHVVAQTSYHFEPIQLSQLTAASARNRAFEYATRGGGSSDDIYFTKDEVSHLNDVSRLFRPISMGLNIMAVIAWSVLFLAVYKKTPLSKSFHVASRILAGLLILSIVCVLAFSSFFETFHRVLFPQGNWAFPNDSLLITLFPESFWRVELCLIVFFLFVCSLLYAQLSVKTKKVYREE